MYSSLGLYTLFTPLASEDVTLRLALGIPGFVLLFWLCILFTLSDSDDDEPISLPQNALSTPWSFFRSQFDFLARGFKLTGQSVYQFRLLHHKVIVLSGEPARREFFSAQGLSLHEGFKILSGAIPMLPGITSEIGPHKINLMHKRLATVQNSDRLSHLIPEVLDDTGRFMLSWGASGTLNPFDAVQHLLFQTTIRCISSAELAEDPAVVLRLKTLYDKLDHETTAASVLLPWFPTPSAVKRLWATKEIYSIVSGAIDARLQSGIARDDTMQLLLDNADDKMVIVGFIMGFLVAGARSTGTTASWLITFLSGHPQWKERAAAEVQQLLECHTPLPSTSISPSDYLSPPSISSLSTRLASIPLTFWEGATPVLDAIIRETLRLAEPHAAMRRNMGPTQTLGGKRVPAGAFVVYPFSDAHLSAELYPDPWRFDPARPQSKMPYAYVGWGAGRTVCLGQRLARLELKLVVAMSVLAFDFRAVDRSGHMLGALPRPNWNDTLTCKPPTGSCFLQYERTKRE